MSLVAGKAFDKIQHLVMLKTISNVEIEGKFLILIKSILKNYSKYHPQFESISFARLEARQGYKLSPHK